MALKDNAWRPIRWTVVLVLLTVAIAGLFLGWFEVCSKTTTKDGIESACNQPTVSDASVVGSVLLVLLILSPDLSEIGVFGISLKRRLEAAEQKAKSSEEKVERVTDRLAIQSTRIDGLAQATASAAAQATVGPIFIGDKAIEHAQAVLPEKERAFLAGRDVSVDETPKPPLDYAAIGELISNWEEINSLLGPTPYRMTQRPPVESSLSEDDVRRFVEIFKEELQIVRAARNTVAHAGAISPEDVTSAVDISNSLLEILRHRRPA